MKQNLLFHGSERAPAFWYECAHIMYRIRLVPLRVVLLIAK